MEALFQLWGAGVAGSAAFYGLARLEGVQPVPWPVLMVNLLLWPFPAAILLLALHTGRRP